MVQYLRANTYQPSIREIGERFGIKSTKTVSEHLQALADKGFLERDPSRSRGVRILGVDLGAQSITVPCFLSMPEDALAARSSRADLHLAIDRRLGGSKGAFFVRAGVGDLAALGVHEGDYVLVEPASLADVESGAVVVAPTATGSSYHRLTRNGGGSVKLEALSGAAGECIVVPEGESINLLGRVAAFFRRMDESTGALNLTHH